MTDSEIITAMECCASEQCDCDDCPINDYCREHSDEMIKQMLDLINRQQTRIKELEERDNQK